MRASAIIATAAVAVLSCAQAGETFAKCTRLAFSVNDYGKEGPTKDAKALLDKHIANFAAERGIKKYSVGTKDVTCELFLDFIVFDEYTCKATASVCWDGPELPVAVKKDGAPAEKAKPAAVKSAPAIQQPPARAAIKTAPIATGTVSSPAATKAPPAPTAATPAAAVGGQSAAQPAAPAPAVVAPVPQAPAAPVPAAAPLPLQPKAD